MKEPQEIISHLYFSNSQKLKEAKCLSVLKSLLPPRLAQAISYIYKNNQKLYIVIDQFGLKMEFNYKRELIKTLLKTINKECALCGGLLDMEVVISVSTKKRREAEEHLKKYAYEERSEGTFENLAQNEEIRALLEKIRESIHANRHD